MSISLCFAVFAMIRASPLRFIRTILPCAEGTRKAVFLRFSCMKKHPAPLFGKAGPIGKGTLLQQSDPQVIQISLMTVRVSDERSSRIYEKEWQYNDCTHKKPKQFVSHALSPPSCR